MANLMLLGWTAAGMDPTAILAISEIDGRFFAMNTWIPDRLERTQIDI